MTEPHKLTDQASDQAPPRAAEDEFDDSPVRAAIDPHTLVLDLDGYEGPLDILLQLARTQKVDLTKISILALAEQYIEFINRARHMQLEVAADYLVMAAWLAYLKSRLLLPPPEEEDGPSGEEMAARLAFQLQRLEAMRTAAQQLMARKQLGVHVFRRGLPEGIRLIKTSVYEGKLYDLLKAYSEQRVRTHLPVWEPKRLAVMAIETARKRLESMLGFMIDWGRLDGFLPSDYGPGKMRRSAVASTLSATLELVRDGHLEIQQNGVFGPLYVRRRNPETSRPERTSGAPVDGAPDGGGPDSGQGA